MKEDKNEENNPETMAKKDEGVEKEEQKEEATEDKNKEMIEEDAKVKEEEGESQKRESLGPYPLLKPRFYSDVASPVDVFRCRDSFACPGGDPGSCGPNMVGRACARCEVGFARQGGCYDEKYCDFFSENFFDFCSISLT